MDVWQLKDGEQWDRFVQLLPLWLAPNMVTLLGFFFILANVGLLVLVMPDLVGPVRYTCLDTRRMAQGSPADPNVARAGPIMAIL
jgi:hypothetical protein